MSTPFRSAFGILSLIVALMSVAVAASAYDVVDGVVDGGTIIGKVVYAGPPPMKKIIIPTKDKDVCGSHIRDADQIVVSPDSGIWRGLVYLKAVAKGKAWETLFKAPAIENRDCDFYPQLQIIRSGELEIVNSDPILHNTHGFLDKRTVFNVALPHQGLRIKKALRDPGMVRVECDAHGWMLGWIYVAENPYYAITSSDGTFALTDVPPGTYTLVAWHDYTGAVETAITVRPNETTSVTVELKK